MKLSEMNTRQAAVCLCRIVEPTERICQDEMLNGRLAEIAKKKDGKGQTLLQLASDIIGTLLPVMLDTHFEDTMEILSALTGKEKTVLEEQKFTETMKDTMESIDEDLIGFFRRSAGSARGK